MSSPAPSTNDASRQPALGRGLAGVLVFSLIVVTLLQASWSLTRQRRFSPDSMNYVNVARNLLGGRGLVQDTVGFGESHFTEHVRTSQPLGVHAPLFPILIAALAATGISAANAALLLPALAYGGVLAAAFLLLRRLHGLRAALLTLACLVVSFPLRQASTAAWAEAPAELLVLLGWLLLVSRAPPSQGRLLAAGLLAGLAFATRYPMIVALLVGAVALFDRRDTKRSIRGALFYSLGFLLVALPILGRNLVATGYWGGASRNPSREPLVDNLRVAASVLFGQYALGPTGRRDPLATRFDREQLQAFLLFASAAAACVALGRRGPGEIRRVLGEPPARRLLAGGFLVYAAFMVVERSIVQFDPLGTRLLLPAHVSLMGLWAAMLTSAFPRPGPRALAVLVVFAGALESAAPVRSLARERPANDARVVRESPRLRWVRTATNEHDLLIAEGSQELAFYMGRASLYFTAAPHMQPISHSDVSRIACEATPRFRNVYLLLNVHPWWNEDDWRAALGAFVADLALGRTSRYPNLEEVGRFSDGVAFLCRCDPAVQRR